MASSAPSTPRRRISSRDLDVDVTFSGGNRSRLPSNDIPRTYSGLYGAGAGAPQMPDDILDSCHEGDGHPSSIQSTPRSPSSSHDDHQKYPSKKHRVFHHYQAGSDLLPFELSRNRNTDWIAAGGPALLLTYIFIVLVVLLTFLAFIPEPQVAWTLTNFVHMLVTLMYLHWIKGNPADYMDGTQGEMNAMTLWEQIISTPATHSYNSSALGKNSSKKKGGHVMIEGRANGSGRDVLVVIPTLLALASCYVSNFATYYAIPNVIVWAIVMLPKVPFMNGVRILGINRTAGIDDGDYLDEDEDDECVDTEDESAMGSLGCDLSESKANELLKDMINEPKKRR
ncbi:hypothetical protein ACHAW6_004491 [Cyclotella cf. meneghiniana]